MARPYHAPACVVVAQFVELVRYGGELQEDALPARVAALGVVLLGGGHDGGRRLLARRQRALAHRRQRPQRLQAHVGLGLQKRDASSTQGKTKVSCGMRRRWRMQRAGFFAAAVLALLLLQPTNTSLP